MKKAFSLVELIVVVGIIAILAAVLIGSFSGSSESAQAARCLSNLKSLAAACQSCTIRACSCEDFHADESSGIANVKLKYVEYPGWISWFSKDKYPAQNSQKDGCRSVSMYSTNEEEYRYALTNGCIWVSISRNAGPYLCPLHKTKKADAQWSYLMNKRISHDDGAAAISSGNRVLLFAEVPFQGVGEWFPEGEGATEDNDAVLDYENNEAIGANHKSGKDWMAHIVFADGHTEKLRIPKDMSGTQLNELTKWLCTGVEVGFSGGTYQELNN